MGVYSEFNGTIKFKDKEHFDTFYTKLVANGWYMPDQNLFIADEPFDLNEYGGEIDKVNLSFTFPQYTINNYHRILNFIEGMNWEGEIRWVSDDGSFEGGVITPQEEISVDLEQWANEYGFKLEYDEELEDYDTEQRCDVMNEFLENPFPPRNSTRFIMEE